MMSLHHSLLLCSGMIMLSLLSPSRASKGSVISFNGVDVLEVEVEDYNGSIQGLLKLEMQRTKKNAVSTTWNSQVPGVLECVEEVCVAGKQLFWKVDVNGKMVDDATMDRIIVKSSDKIRIQLTNLDRKTEL
mmetsp:Transcript_13741/g.33596  ORF Transcript_13741/g.33596 Transcript_13741/m.33596 type:complete len:132 (+) Transcript_13741:111-506(+)